MAFKCGFCGKAQPNNTKPIPTVLSTRPQTYVNYVMENGKVVDQINSQGTEIVKQISICKNCAFPE